MQITGGAVCCQSRDGSKTVTFYQQDSLLCISADGTEQWYKPAYDLAMNPYESMRRLYEDFHRYYYPEPLHQLEDITLDDQAQVEALITAYFGALEQKDYAAAWELMSSNRQGKGYPKEPSISEGGRIGDIKLVSMEGYLPPYIARNLPPYEFKMADVPADTPTVWFLVKPDVQSAAGFEWENGINERFVNVAKETDGTWRIDSLATGP
ncbi:MAG: hypothetical protein GX847_02795 [Clostridiales bacterium]|nr:hypothetical protein [Clostridiales bacterium]